jgi:hypothetical protein
MNETEALASCRSTKARFPPEADVPADGVPSFILHGGHFGAPDRMKLGTLM